MWEEADVKKLLLALPPDGQWASSQCCRKDILMALLDEGSPLIEENEQPDEGVPGVEWRVRLTRFGMTIVAEMSRSESPGGDCLSARPLHRGIKLGTITK